MNSALMKYELGLTSFGSAQNFRTTDYFCRLNSIKSRKNQYPALKKFKIKTIMEEPYKNFYIRMANKKFELKLDKIQTKPVIPKINIKFKEMQTTLKNNKDRARELYNRAISLENEKFSDRVFTQRPQLMNNKLLEKLYMEHHLKYLRTLNRVKNVNNNDNSLKTLKIELPKISTYDKERNNRFSKTEANLDSESEKKNNTVEDKSHEYKDISHNKQGHIFNDNI